MRARGEGAKTFCYDSLGRPTSLASDLGSFTLTYLGQITSRQLVDRTLATTWSHAPNSGGLRRSGISNVGLPARQYSTFSYTTTPGDFITESSDATTVYRRRCGEGRGVRASAAIWETRASRRSAHRRPRAI